MYYDQKKQSHHLQEGLSTLHYNVTKTIVHPLYTHIKVEAGWLLLTFSHDLQVLDMGGLNHNFGSV